MGSEDGVEWPMDMASAASDLPGGPAPRRGPGVEVSGAGVPSWRLCLAATLGLAGVALWVAVARQEGRFARNAVSPESRLLSPDELEDQLHV